MTELIDPETPTAAVRKILAVAEDMGRPTIAAMMLIALARRDYTQGQLVWIVQRLIKPRPLRSRARGKITRMVNSGIIDLDDGVCHLTDECRVLLAKMYPYSVRRGPVVTPAVRDGES